MGGRAPPRLWVGRERSRVGGARAHACMGGSTCTDGWPGCACRCACIRRVRAGGMGGRGSPNHEPAPGVDWGLGTPDLGTRLGSNILANFQPFWVGLHSLCA